MHKNHTIHFWGFKCRNQLSQHQLQTRIGKFRNRSLQQTNWITWLYAIYTSPKVQGQYSLHPIFERHFLQRGYAIELIEEWALFDRKNDCLSLVKRVANKTTSEENNNRVFFIHTFHLITLMWKMCLQKNDRFWKPTPQQHTSTKWN